MLSSIKIYACLASIALASHSFSAFLEGQDPAPSSRRPLLTADDLRYGDPVRAQVVSSLFLKEHRQIPRNNMVNIIIQIGDEGPHGAGGVMLTSHWGITALHSHGITHKNARIIATRSPEIPFSKEGVYDLTQMIREGSAIRVKKVWPLSDMKLEVQGPDAGNDGVDHISPQQEGNLSPEEVIDIQRIVQSLNEYPFSITVGEERLTINVDCLLFHLSSPMEGEISTLPLEAFNPQLPSFIGYTHTAITGWTFFTGESCFQGEAPPQIRTANPTQKIPSFVKIEPPKRSQKVLPQVLSHQFHLMPQKGRYASFFRPYDQEDNESYVFTETFGPLHPLLLKEKDDPFNSHRHLCRPITAGMSGSPMFDAAGTLRGIVSQSLRMQRVDGEGKKVPLVANIYQAITPEMLDQIHQIMKKEEA